MERQGYLLLKKCLGFENIPQNGPEYSHRNLVIARFLVTAVRIDIGGLLSWLVSLSSSVPELTRHGLRRVSMLIPNGGGCCQSVVLSVSLALGESVHSPCQILSVWGPLANESIPLKHVLGRGVGVRSSDVALNYLLRTYLSLKHPLSCRAFKQLECMAKSRVSFWWTLNVSLLIRNHEESYLKRTMGKSSVSWQYLL